MKRFGLLLPMLLVFCLLLTACFTTPGGETPGEDYETVSIAEATATCTEDGVYTDAYYIRASVTAVGKAGEMTIADSTGELYVSGIHGEDEDGKYVSYADLDTKPMVDYEVLVCVMLKSEGGVISAWDCLLISAEFSADGYTEATITEAREASVGAKLMVDGVVATITYSNGLVPAGIILVDETSSIYVYDAALAAEVKVGNRITIGGTKAYWVLEDEQSNASKFGYKGSCQLESVQLFANDKKSGDFDKSWIEELTVKELLDTPVTENITTKIYKVTALIQEKPGNGFTNFYLYDLDGETGTYSYSQCNGSDFTWLREFEGKICTVYVTALNAKSTASDCYFRFVPVQVIDEGFTFDTADAPNYAVKYHGVTQLLSQYSGDPAIELNTLVSSELLGFEGATLSFTSSNESVVKFNAVDGKVILNCPGYGTATVTVTGSYGGKSYSESVEITVTENAEIPYISVEEAIAAELNTEVTVKGIVGPSLVNKSGFYLMGDEGMIAVLVDASAFANLAIGNEVIVKGIRAVSTNGGTSYFGQSHIKDATVVANAYGSHEYSTDYFVTDKTPAEFYALDPKVDYTTTVYVIEVTVTYIEDQYYTSMSLVADDGTSIGLYCSGASQYSWLQRWNGQKVTVEIAAVNWNDKTYYRGCVLAVYTDDGKVYNELNFSYN